MYEFKHKNYLQPTGYNTILIIKIMLAGICFEGNFLFEKALGLKGTGIIMHDNHLLIAVLFRYFIGTGLVGF